MRKETPKKSEKGNGREVGEEILNQEKPVGHRQGKLGLAAHSARAGEVK